MSNEEKYPGAAEELLAQMARANALLRDAELKGGEVALDKAELESHKARLEKDLEDTKHSRAELQIEVERLTKELEETDKDPLTGLLNRRGFEFMVSEIRKIVASGVIMFLDMDYFKIINDVRGHLAGDAALKALADYLRYPDNTRKTDAVGRWGGDEFVVYFPGATVEDIAGKFLKLGGEKSGENLLRINVPVRCQIPGESLDFQVTCSVGIAVWEENESLNDAISKADKLLYEAKRQKRNRLAAEQKSSHPEN